MHEIVDDGRVVRIKGIGFFSEDEVRHHFHELARIILERRRSSRQVMAAIDLRAASIQAPSVAKLITESTNRLYSDPRDRVAILVGTMLLKLQFERVHQKQGFGVFLKEADADRFLFLDQDRPIEAT